MTGMAVLFLVAFVALMGAMAAGFVALVGRRYGRDRARRQSWSHLAGHFGLRYEPGDPLGLATRLGVTRSGLALPHRLDRESAVTGVASCAAGYAEAHGVGDNGDGRDPPLPAGA